MAECIQGASKFFSLTLCFAAHSFVFIKAHARPVLGVTGGSASAKEHPRPGVHPLQLSPEEVWVDSQALMQHDSQAPAR